MAAEEHHTAVEPEIIEPEILPKQVPGKTAALKAVKPVDAADAEDDEDIGDELPEDDVTALDPDADILPEGDTLPVPSQQHLPSLSSSKDSLHLYLREVSRFPMLKPDEEFDLARRVQKTGDSDAAFRLVSSHLRLVVKIAMDFQRRWMQNVLDLIQEGNVGLMRAVNKFDPDKGIKFSYYAAFWIRAYILKFIMDNWRMVKIGTTQAQRKLFYNLNRERQKLIAEASTPTRRFSPSASAWARIRSWRCSSGWTPPICPSTPLSATIPAAPRAWTSCPRSAPALRKASRVWKSPNCSKARSATSCPRFPKRRPISLSTAS